MQLVYTEFNPAHFHDSWMVGNTSAALINLWHRWRLIISGVCQRSAETQKSSFCLTAEVHVLDEPFAQQQRLEMARHRDACGRSDEIASGHSSLARGTAGWRPQASPASSRIS